MMLCETTTDGELEPLLGRIAEGVCRRGLAVPAIFFLEMHKPLTGLAQALAGAGAPLLALLFSPGFLDALLKILESRERVERLIQLLEERSAVREGRA